MGLPVTIRNSDDRPTVVVFGGYGFFGTILVRDLLATTRANIIVVGRRLQNRVTDPRITFVRADINDLSATQPMLVGASVVVHCAGPYQVLPLNPLLGAIAAGAHYVDLAEDRRFVRRVAEHDEAARRAGVAIMTGMSVVPGLAAVLAQSALEHFDELQSVRTFIAPGTRGSRGSATLRTLLFSAGRCFQVVRDGRDRPIHGWSEPEWVEFPPPVGWRRQYLAMETADLDLFPDYFGVRRVEFKAGSEFASLNRCLAAGAWLRAHTGLPPLERCSGMLQRALSIFGSLGTDRGGVLVEVTGTKSGRPTEWQIAVVAEQHGERIPSIPAAVATGALLRGEVAHRGVVPLHDWITPARMFECLAERGLRVWSRSAAGHPWQLVCGLDAAS